ncbi:MAG: tyrosine--tRNA ligase [Candidatus Levybacteria bacterium]|nr:tyrosine--tRNA ligase [Candidatus Levybacteria bacterium]
MDQIEELLTRAVANIIPSKNRLEEKLKSGEKLNVYLGIDPTAIKIHLGHAVPLRKLQRFADLGHNVTFLIGDFTALVGDTSDKDSERPILTKEEIEENFKTYKSQAQKLLNFSKVNIRYNSEWLSKLTYADVFKLKQQFSLNDFISRELIKKRLEDGKSIRLDETEYPIMQGYDSYFMDTDLQIGGTDQTFNMQAGRILQRKLRNKESFILATEFLMGTDGRKMSKSWGNAIWLDDTPFEMFRKIMAINDDQILNYFNLATNTPIDKIPTEEEIEQNPLNIKKRLATAIVSELHSEGDAKKAEKEFERVVQKGELPEKVAEITVNEDGVIDDDFLVEHGLASSKSDAKRLFDQNGVSLNGTGIKLGEGFAANSGEDLILSVGKKVVKLNVT